MSKKMICMLLILTFTSLAFFDLSKFGLFHSNTRVLLMISFLIPSPFYGRVSVEGWYLLGCYTVWLL
jgi:hypothetical protein